jgi:RNA polymerase sigma-70 factor (ECF subfamily)
VEIPESTGDLTEWMRQALEGNEAAYRCLLAGVAARLRGQLRGRLSGFGASDVDAEDVVQETLLAIHLKRHTWNRVERFEPWLAAVARNKLIDAMRRRGRRVELPIEEVEACLADDSQPDQDNALDVPVLLSQLGRRAQQIVRLISIEGEDVRTVARRLDMTEVNVRVTLHRSLKSLAALYRKGGP